MKIKIREFKEADTNFILSTWIRSYYSNGTGYRERMGVFHKGMETLIKGKYENRSIIPLVACLDEDEDAILGFAVFGTDYTLHYVCTKETYKRMGICKMLLSHMYKSRKDIVASHWTLDIKFIRKMYNVEYNRFKFFN